MLVIFDEPPYLLNLYRLVFTSFYTVNPTKINSINYPFKNASRILICPLDWGLGHASRCVPIIHSLLKQGHEVIIAASGGPLVFLQQEFPHLGSVNFEGYSIRYSKHYLWLTIAWQIPKLLLGIIREHMRLKQLCAQHRIDGVISDNRFGCWHASLPSIFISHQIFIRVPVFEGLIRRLNFWCMQQYQKVWIPDVAGSPNFSGQLSHGSNIPAHAEFIGLLSRFQPKNDTTASSNNDAICVLLSGPEPQRTLLENKLIEQLLTLNLQATVVRGLPAEKQKKENTANLHFENHLPTKALQQLIESSGIVVCRSGYSSIMDLAILGKKAIFIPTPGQSEQVYLADYFMTQKICFSQAQDKFDLAFALQQSKHYKGFNAASYPRS